MAHPLDLLRSLVREVLSDVDLAKRSCTDKVRYPSWSVAQDAAANAKLKSGRDISVYKCPFCGSFHITKLGEEASIVASDDASRAAFRMGGVDRRRRR